MDSYEKEIISKMQDNTALAERLRINILKYFWESNPLTVQHKKSIPRFLSEIQVLKNFTEMELFTLSKYMHVRTFAPTETVFEQDEPGVGFYFILSGHIEIVINDINIESVDPAERKSTPANYRMVIELLEKYDYFGELAILQENSIRSASAIAKDSAMLLGIFKPDVEELINDHPKVAAKLLQSISIIIANRLFSVTKEMKILNYKLDQLEKSAKKDDKKQK